MKAKFILRSVLRPILIRMTSHGQSESSRREPSVERPPRPKHTSWEVSSGRVESAVIDIYAMSSALISRLQAHADKIVQAKRQFGLTAYLEVVLWISVDEATSTPAIGFDMNVISFLYAVGAHIDVDTYIKTA